MTEAAPEAPAQEPPTEQPPANTEGGQPKDWEAEATRLQDELKKARKWEERAKENHAKVQQYEREKLPEAERSAAEAEERGRKAAATEFGKRLATSEIRAEAASSGADLEGVFDYLDLSRFVGEDGEPDAKAIKSFVAGLPKKDAAPPSFDGGGRSTASGGDDMNKLIRAGFGRG